MCQAEQELSILSERLRAVGARVLSLDEDPGELTNLELLAVIEGKLKDRGPAVMEMYTRSLIIRRRLESVQQAAQAVYDFTESSQGDFASQIETLEGLVKKMGVALAACREDNQQPLPNGAMMVVTERMRQILQEGWTAEHDDRHDIGELCSAAGAYLFAGDCLANAKNLNEKYQCTPQSLTLEVLDGANDVSWPWEAESFKVDADPVRNLVKCGALVLAEIDRLLRLKNTDGTQPGPTSGKEGEG